jgi:tRNA pseudouridine13 synthase
MLKSGIPLENTLGIKWFMSDTPGIGGYLRRSYEDFLVKEVPSEKAEDDVGEYTHFTLVKTNWDTIRSISALSKALGVSRKRFGFAGTKDRKAVTSQRMSVWNVEAERLKSINIKDLKLSDFVRSNERLSVGDLLGNEFEITVRDPDKLDQAEIEKCRRAIDERGVPNYFGYQRFGLIRPNTHIIGRKLLDRDIRGAVLSYIADYYEGERDDAKEARRQLKEDMDFKRALTSFPKRLGYERTMIEHLHKNPTDFAGALRRLHKKLRQMFIHGYQSYLFNLILSKMIEAELDIPSAEIPLFGYKSTFSEGVQGEIEREVLEEEGVGLERFNIPSLPELKSKGSFRKACLETKVTYRLNEDNSVVFNFFLSKGNYGTMVMREFMKADPLNY